MRKIFLAILLIAGFTAVNAQMKWMTFQEAIVANDTVPKKIFIDIYTDWCGWCKVMDKQTFSDSATIATMEKYFYPVKFNAESKDSIRFMGYALGYNAQNRAHDLAVALLKGQMSFPSTSYLDEQDRLITNIPGFMKPDEIKPVLIYFGEDHFKTTTWEDFMREYRKNNKKPQGT